MIILLLYKKVNTILTEYLSDIFESLILT